jgi:hypothetical protein
LKRRTTPRKNQKAPDVGPATPKIVQQFERALAGKNDVRDKIRSCSLNPSPTIKDFLKLAWLRNWLTFLEPPLRDGEPPTGASVWAYWVEHREEYAHYNSLDVKICGYLYSSEEIRARSMSTQLEILDLINTDTLTCQALYPVVDEMYRTKSGRPATRGNIALQALQFKIDNHWIWRQITNAVCDCGKSLHDDYCQANLRQSIRGLEKLLRKCGLRVLPQRHRSDYRR